MRLNSGHMPLSRVGRGPEIETLAGCRASIDREAKPAIGQRDGQLHVLPGDVEHTAIHLQVLVEQAVLRSNLVAPYQVRPVRERSAHRAVA